MQHGGCRLCYLVSTFFPFSSLPCWTPHPTDTCHALRIDIMITPIPSFWIIQVAQSPAPSLLHARLFLTGASSLCVSTLPISTSKVSAFLERGACFMRRFPVISCPYARREGRNFFLVRHKLDIATLTTYSRPASLGVKARTGNRRVVQCTSVQYL